MRLLILFHLFSWARLSRVYKFDTAGGGKLYISGGIRHITIVREPDGEVWARIHRPR